MALRIICLLYTRLRGTIEQASPLFCPNLGAGSDTPLYGRPGHTVYPVTCLYAPKKEILHSSVIILSP
jgi:hypothetical protein